MPARLLSDERLAREVGSGHENAFTALFNRYHQQLYRYCRSLTGSDQDAQDALQSTFANALIALRAGRRNAPLRPWLYRIAHNESISLVRSRRPTLEVPEELASTVDVHESAQQRERLATLVADLQELPERQRGALVMRELSGLSHAEIAQALEVSVGAAKQTILEARRSLLEFAEGRAMGCDEVLRILSDADGRSLRGRRVRGHLRTCSSCSAFANAIPDRRTDMLALWPILPAASAAGLLAKLTGAGSGHGGGGGAAGLAAGSAAKGAAATISLKAAAAAGVAVVATATVGAVTVLHHSTPSPATPVVHNSSHAGRPTSGHPTTRTHHDFRGAGVHHAGSVRLTTGGSKTRGNGTANHANGNASGTAPGGHGVASGKADVHSTSHEPGTANHGASSRSALRKTTPPRTKPTKTNSSAKARAEARANARAKARAEARAKARARARAKARARARAKAKLKANAGKTPPKTKTTSGTSSTAGHSGSGSAGSGTATPAGQTSGSSAKKSSTTP